MQVKDNQLNLRKAIQQWLESRPLQQDDDRQTYTYTETGHGRRETRTLLVSPGLSDHLDWPKNAARTVEKISRQAR